MSSDHPFPPDDEQYTHLLKLRAIYQQRLRILEENAATLGLEAPPSLTIQLRETRKELEHIEKVLGSPISPDLANALGTTGQYQLLLRELQLLRDFVRESTGREREDRRERQATVDQRDLAFLIVQVVQLLALVAIMVFVLMHMR